MKRDELIKRIQSWNLSHDDMAALAEVIPELRESEDERIRKIITDSVFYQYGAGVEYKDVLDYLDKLEKQKYNRMQPIYDNQESFESALDKAWKSYNESGARTVDSCEDDYTECAHAKGFREGFLFGLVKQKEQKSAEWDELQTEFRSINEAFEDGKKEVIEHPEKYGLQKPAEWSEEDEKMLEKLLSIIEPSNGYAEIRDWLLPKLKSLRPQPQTNCCDPKFTMPEFAIQNIQMAIDLLEKKKYFAMANCLKETLDFLSKRYWKPNKRQMEALESCGQCNKEIYGLYQQLKKL